jgi:peptidoglycan/LPS O-acetylase OafA/YrhL
MPVSVPWQAPVVQPLRREPGPSAKAKLQLPALTGLRFFLAVWVIVHHLTGRGGMLDAWAGALPFGGDDIVRCGYLAVGTFFVLSGFVLARSYPAEWSRPRLARYAVARFARIYPVYTLSLLVVAPFIAAEKLAPGTKCLLLADYGLLMQGWTGWLPVNWNTPAWTLSCEAFFYVCFPLAAVLLAGLRWRSIAALTVIAWVLPGLLARAGVPAAFLPLFHLADFVTGIAAARAFELLAPLSGRGHWLYLPGFAIAAAFITHQGVAHDLMDPNSVLRPVNAAILIGLALGGGAIARLLSSAAAVFLGKASYAMYILHVPLLWWYARWGHRSLTATQAGFVFVAVVVASSSVVFRFFEEPANRMLRQRLVSPRCGERDRRPRELRP